MADILARFALLDSQSMEEGSSDEFQVKCYSSGALERTANGLDIKTAGVTSAQLAGSIAFDKLADYANIARLDQAETIAAVWAFGTNLPTFSADPTTGNQGVRKAYVDALFSGLAWKSATRVIAVSNVALTGAQTIDSVVCSDGDRILCVGQTSASQNGIWIMRTGAWERPADFYTGNGASSAACFVQEGTSYGDEQWFCTADAASDVIDTDNLTWSQMGGQTITAGDGLAQTGNAFDVNPGQGIELSGDAVTIKLNGTSLAKDANGLCIASGGVTYAMIASAAIGTGSSKIAAGDHDHGASGADASQYWGTDSGSSLGWHDVPDLAGQRLVEKFTLTSTNITNGYVTLADAPTTPNETILLVKGAGNQFYGDDYAMDGGYTTRLTWDALDLDGVLEEGDKLTVIYN